MRGTRWLVPKLALIGLLGSGCGILSENDPICTLVLAQGLNVLVRDSVTGIPAGRGAIVGAMDGTYSEGLRFLGDVIASDSLTFVGAPERAGTYMIVVTKPGYLTWVRTGVRVVADECHVHPVTVEVRLQPFTN